MTDRVRVRARPKLKSYHTLKRFISETGILKSLISD